MNTHTRAGIDIYGAVLRYAEVQQHGGRYSLLRLGSCDFDFNVVDEVLRATSREYLETILDALDDVFEGSLASRLHVTLHPPDCYSFFTPLPVAVDADEQRRQAQREADLLVPSGAAHPLHLTLDGVYTETLDEGDAVEWTHVLALREPLHTRFDRIFRMLPHLDHRMTISMEAVAKAVERIERQAGQEPEARQAPFSLAVGRYPSHTEFTLCRHSRWFYSQYAASGTPADSAYFARLLLQRLHVPLSAVGRLYVYGQGAGDAPLASLETAFDVRPERLNPLELVDVDPNSMVADFDAEAYVPCIGVAL